MDAAGDRGVEEQERIASPCESELPETTASTVQGSEARLRDARTGASDEPARPCTSSAAARIASRHQCRVMSRSMK